MKADGREGKMPGIGRVVSFVLVGIPLIELEKREGGKKRMRKGEEVQGEGIERGGDWPYGIRVEGEVEEAGVLKDKVFCCCLLLVCLFVVFCLFWYVPVYFFRVVGEHVEAGGLVVSTSVVVVVFVVAADFFLGVGWQMLSAAVDAVVGGRTSA